MDCPNCKEEVLKTWKNCPHCTVSLQKPVHEVELDTLRNDNVTLKAKITILETEKEELEQKIKKAGKLIP